VDLQTSTVFSAQTNHSQQPVSNVLTTTATIQYKNGYQQIQNITLHIIVILNALNKLEFDMWNENTNRKYNMVVIHKYQLLAFPVIAHNLYFI